jgi:hypothetical protein
MTSVEQFNLQECEAIIETNYRAFVEVGLALLRIKEMKWYKAAGFSSFESYCNERWGMSKSYAYRTIGAAQFVKESPIGDTLPNEHAARRAIESERKPATETAAYVPQLIDHDEWRCDEIMKELRGNPELARLVRIELMKWYALNS